MAIEFRSWYKGFADYCDKNGQPEAARVIRETIGKDGDGGLAKCMADYNGANPLDLKDVTATVFVTVDGVEKEVKYRLPLKGNMAGGIAVLAALTQLLALGHTEK